MCGPRRYSSSYSAHPDLHSFPTRRSSDLCLELGKLRLPLVLVVAHLRLVLEVEQHIFFEATQLQRVDLKRYAARSEEHTSELQSHSDLVCRLLLEKKKTTR